MFKKSLSAIISVILAFTLCICTCSSAFAATSGKKYVKEVILSYGKTAEEAKKWLTDNDYEVLDSNLNDGADDTFSTKRAVYLGYKTTDKADEAITDMKLMNMKGGYSVQDYQMILSEQKDNLKVFFDNFKVAVQEYRNNYNAGQQRAIAAHDLLNMLYDDDTQQSLGDLLLNRVREEYTDEEYNALTAEEQAKVADMTTILMQGNANAVLAMEQIIATATDESATPWTNRYQEAKTYDEMIDELVDNQDYTVNEAEKELASKYNDDAKKIAANFDNYKVYLDKYINADISFESSDTEIEAYKKAHEDFDLSEWFAAGTQYEAIKVLKNDDISFCDLITSNDYDVTGDDMYMLYPLVSVLSDGQRACLDFLPTYQLMAIGLNDDKTIEAAMQELNIDSIDTLKNVSIYDGVDRSVFGEDVALTGDAYKMQASTGENPTDNWTDHISKTTYALFASLSISTMSMIFCWTRSSHYSALANDISEMGTKLTNLYEKQQSALNIGDKVKANDLEDQWNQLQGKYQTMAQTDATGLAKFLKYAGIATTCITAVLLGFTIWSTYQDLKEYYNATFTPIPSNMVNQGVNDKDEKVYTYYKAVKCNRVAQNMVTDNTKLLGDYGDLNGDVGKQWVALYTTTDSAAGDPITTDFKVQYKDTNVPDDRTALSIFCESVAQNLTNKKAGYTYADSKGGIYLFFGNDENALAGSVISDGAYYVLVGGGCAIVAAAIAFFVGRAVGKKGKKEEEISVA